MRRALMQTLGGSIICLIIILTIQYFVFPFLLNTHAQTTNIDFSNPDFGGANSIPDLVGIDEQVDLEVSPENPQPGDIIESSIQAPGLDLTRSMITWSVNGVKVLSGIGAISFKTQAGALGKVLVISVKINPSSGARPIEKSFSISSQNVDILWEADSYTPPFFKGRPLYGEEGNVTLVAMPNIIDKSGKKVSPSNLVYKWSLNNSVLGSKSGYGKNVIYYSGSILAQEDFFQVEVTAPDGTTGEGAMVVAPRTPITLLYENDPLYGVMFNNAITDGYKLKGKEIRIDAYPYFFSTLGKTSYNLSYAWTLNGDSLPIPTNKNSAVFRNTNDLTGSSNIAVTTDSTTHILQTSKVEAVLNF